MRQLILLSMGLVVTTAWAEASTLNGSMITVDLLAPNSATVALTQNAVVQAPFPEISCPGANAGGGICGAFGLPAQFTIQNLSIIFAQQGSGGYAIDPFNGLGFFNLNFGNGSTVTGFNLISNLPGFTNANVSFTSNSIKYNLEGLSFTNGVSIELDLTTSSTPEPANMLLLVSGLAALGLLWRVRNAPL